MWPEKKTTLAKGSAHEPPIKYNNNNNNNNSSSLCLSLASRQTPWQSEAQMTTKKRKFLATQTLLLVQSHSEVGPFFLPPTPPPGPLTGGGGGPLDILSLAKMNPAPFCSGSTCFPCTERRKFLLWRSD